ncbi:MAG: D-glycero-beta-D-manno-heptose 1-phosphate adenylyltransferase [Rhodanobacteraceae bacterium]
MSAYLRCVDGTRLNEILERVRRLRVWIIGDIMLDEYVAGSADRISPEAPVPVVRAGGIDSRLGGAANVARQVVALGAHATLAGLLGEDEAGDQILRLCSECAIDTRAVTRVAGRHSTRKLRVLARNHQMLRLDWEDPTAFPRSLVPQMIEHLKREPPPDVVILSDYSKGVLTQQTIDGIAGICRPLNIRIVVDPKRRDFSEYRGANLLTPNLRELQLAARHAFDPDDANAIARTARTLAVAAGLDALVVTLGDRGMLIVPASDPEVAIPASSPHAVSDPTGAGDTVVATLGTCLGAGATLVEAAHIANVAAGIAVCRVGAVAVEVPAITAALGGGAASSVLGTEDVTAKVGAWRAAGKRIAFTNGCFDLLHAGHLSLLHQAANCADKLVVGINSDASIQRLKGPGRPIVPENERAALLAALACVDAVTIFDQDTPLELLRLLRPEVLVKGSDYRLDQIVGRDLVEAGGGRVLLVPLVPEKSSTALIERMMHSLQRN